MVATIASAAMNVGLNFYCIRRFGYIAAGYTTLFCYMAYTIAHYCFMRKICRDYMNGEMVYNLKILLIITVSFLTLGFAFLFTYTNQFVRYAFIAVMIITAVLKRKWLTSIVQQLMRIRKDNKENNE